MMGALLKSPSQAAGPCRRSVCSSRIVARPSRPRSPSDRKSTRLNSSHTVIYTLSLHDALPIYDGGAAQKPIPGGRPMPEVSLLISDCCKAFPSSIAFRSEEHTSELQSHSDLHSFPTRRSSDL